MVQVRDEAFRQYFAFMEERMNMFWRRYHGQTMPYTSNKILQSYKFTNVFRATDRVSQYLIKEVINGSDKCLTEEDILLNILIFKVFNKIDTWEFIKRHFPTITIKNYDAEKIGNLLTKRREQGPIFNGAYIMTGSSRLYTAYKYKHQRWLQMIQMEIINEKKLSSIAKAKSLEEVYLLLKKCTFIGPFLAYQYAIDFNYSDVIDFNENSFVVAGIGARRGIMKCFSGLNGFSFEDAIRYTYDNLDFYQLKYGYNFNNLFGREPKLIDVQNCFCETDKYLREKMPSLKIGNKRIKQRYIENNNRIQYFFPPKWKINMNENRHALKIHKNGGLSLFHNSQ